MISVLTIFNVKAQVPPRTAAGTNNPKKAKKKSRVPHSSENAMFQSYLSKLSKKETG